MHTHLAHAIVRFLGLTSPQELAEYGMFSAADLVDLVSRVCDFSSYHFFLKTKNELIFKYTSLQPTHLLYPRLL